MFLPTMQCAWSCAAQFSRNHRQLKGSAGAVGVLHTHSRRLEFHPHVHLAMPGAAFDVQHGLWCSLRKTRKGGHYLFNQNALAAVFRGKLLAALNAQGLTAPVCLPERWRVDCKAVGNGHKALVYLGRYLSRGVIQERDIVRCADGQVTFRYRDSTSGKNTLRTVNGAHFLWLVLQHVLPKGLRRSRNFGLLHPNCNHRQRLLTNSVYPSQEEFLVSALPAWPRDGYTLLGVSGAKWYKRDPERGDHNAKEVPLEPIAARVRRVERQ